VAAGGLGHAVLPTASQATQIPMRLSLTGLRTRVRNGVERSARGTDVPAGLERGDGAEAASSRERGRMRRRLRELRRLREAALLELGALALEAHRHDREDTPVLRRKAAEAAALDDEARALAQALGSDGGLDTVVTAGVAGPCPTCGTLNSTSARFCSTCGTALDGRPDAAPGDEDDTTRELRSTNGDGTTPHEAELEKSAGGDL
jgi:hypothetical protein